MCTSSCRTSSGPFMALGNRRIWHCPARLSVLSWPCGQPPAVSEAAAGAEALPSRLWVWPGSRPFLCPRAGAAAACMAAVRFQGKHCSIPCCLFRTICERTEFGVEEIFLDRVEHLNDLVLLRYKLSRLQLQRSKIILRKDTSAGKSL